MTFLCECCPTLCKSVDAYFGHLITYHDTGELARVLEPSLFGGAVLNEAPAAHPRVWDRWDQGGRSGPARRTPPDAPAPEPARV